MEEKENYQEIIETNEELGNTNPSTEETTLVANSEEEVVSKESPAENTGESENETRQPEPVQAPEPELDPKPDSEPEIVSEQPIEGNGKDITERLAAIEEALKHSNRLFESKLLYDAAKEDVITRLHKELQSYKDDQYKKILKPIIMEMIVFADSMRILVSKYEETPDEALLFEQYQKLRKEFLKIGDHIDDLIYNYGIESFVSKAGEEFNPRTQQAKKTTVTEIADEHKKIISSLSPGYTWDEQMLRRESVHINTFEQKQENKENSN
jgi:molecular chaperone GrpE (heat shock protein)